jgi:pyruvate,water dikinase
MSSGGKGDALRKLARAGFRVPRFVVIDSSHFVSFLASREVPIAALLRSGRSPLEVAASVEEHLRTCATPSASEAAIGESLARAWSDWDGRRRFAVRSSALGEDGKEQSFAGQYDTFLGVAGKKEILERIRLCWCSKFSARAIEYASTHGLDPLGPMAVIVQEMVRSDVSGVMFTANPVALEPEQFVISASRGLGEGVVSGSADCDEWVLDQPGGGGVLSERVSDGSRGSCLTRGQLSELFQLGEAVEKGAGFVPQDIEWAYEGKTLFILQSRPITTLDGVRKDLPKEVFDSSNIGESYIGVCTPLTLSFVQQNYQRLVEALLEDLGLGRRAIEESRAVTSRLVVPHEGHLYYRLDRWYALFDFLPGGSLLKPLFSSFIGSAGVAPAAARGGKFVGLFQGLAALRRLVLGYARRSSGQGRFEADYEALVREYAEERLDRLESSDELRRALKEFHDRLFPIWRAPTFNDLYSVVAYGLCKKLFLRLHRDKKETDLQQALKLGRGIEGLGPIEDMAALRSVLLRDPNVVEGFRSASVAEIVEEFRSGKLALRFPDADAAIRRFVKKWQYRGVDELKLEGASFAEAPGLIFENIRAELDLASKEGPAHGSDANPPGEAGSSSRVMRAVMDRTREALSKREKYRIYRGEIFGITRSISMRAGRALAREGYLSDPSDVLYLEMSELYPGPDRSGFAASAAARRAEHATYRGESVPQRFYRYGETLLVPLRRSARSGEGLVGEGCFSGEVEAEFLQFRPSIAIEDCRGRILVLRNAEPGHVVYFRHLKGVVIERGSLLSHCVIAARELKIPVIIGVDGLTERLPASGRLRMNGETGSVRLC